MENRFCESCDCELAEYEYDGKVYCSECLLEKLEEDKKIESWKTKSYMLDGEYLGNDNDNSLDEIIDSLSESFGVKSLEV